LKAEKSPFDVLFEYGGNREGCWNYPHMVLQFEDTVDVLHLICPTFETDFIFDHSAGNFKQQFNGLNQLYINNFFGGRYFPMRETVIESDQGFLGPFQPMYTECWRHTTNDHFGQLCMSPTLREAT
jgi:hypothetical protein